MTKRIRNILTGVGSVMVIMPNTPTAIQFRRFHASSDTKAIRRDWNSVGGYIRHAVGAYAEREEAKAGRNA